MPISYTRTLLRREQSEEYGWEFPPCISREVGSLYCLLLKSGDQRRFRLISRRFRLISKRHSSLVSNP
jgi:hypothetical protein